jgi:hypothetical protein
MLIVELYNYFFNKGKYKRICNTCVFFADSNNWCRDLAKYNLENTCKDWMKYNEY